MKVRETQRKEKAFIFNSIEYSRDKIRKCSLICPTIELKPEEVNINEHVSMEDDKIIKAIVVQFEGKYHLFACPAGFNKDKESSYKLLTKYNLKKLVA